MRPLVQKLHKPLSRLLAALLSALQLLSPAMSGLFMSKQAVAGEISAQAATHFIANADPRCLRDVVPQEQSSGNVRPRVPAAPYAAPALPAPAAALVEPKREAQPLLKGSVATAVMPPMVSSPAPQLHTKSVQDAARQTVTTQKHDPNPVKRAATDPVSTFSIDVDTGAYSSVRGLLRKGMDVPAGAVRVEEMVNYFDYAYARPEQQGSTLPFAVHTEIAPSPWNAHNHLLRVGLQARDTAKDSLPAANLVFLVDVSGSMNIPHSLPLVQDAMLGLVQQLRAQDRVSIVTYASGTQVVLPPTSGAEKTKLADVICGLRAGGSTAGASGIRLAYEQAKAGFIAGGINRILLATDGDFNVGVSNTGQLKEMVAAQRQHGISLSTLGVGYASYNDHLMEQVADAGDGKYSFMDNLAEGRKVLVNEFTSTLQTVAQDVKLQLEFNPAVVKEYRLIGYENRQLAREDFSNDQVDAGDIGAGHRVTALYEITLTGKPGLLPEERYAANRPVAGSAMNKDELAYMKIRFKTPSSNPTAAKSQEIAQAVLVKDIKAQSSADFNFAAAVAGFGQIMAQGKHMGTFGLTDVARLAQEGVAQDKFGLRKEFVELVQLAQGKGTPVGQNKTAP